MHTTRIPIRFSRNTCFLIGYYLPLMKHRQPSSKRTRYSLIPLFKGYIFINCDEADQSDIYRSNCASRIIAVKDPETLVHELRQIHHALSLDKPVCPVELLDIGQRVQIKKGSLKGLEGTIIRKDKKYRLCLSVTSIMQAVSVEIDADMVETLKP